MREKSIQSQIFAAIGSRPDVRLFRNNVGVAWQGEVTRLQNGDVLIRNPRRVVYGLCEGSSDLIGFRRLTIRPEHVGRQVAQFVALEVKSKTGRPSPEQLNFLRVVQASGGAGGVARGVEEVLGLLDDDGGLFGTSGESNVLTGG
jgi:hypothetical protein